VNILPTQDGLQIALRKFLLEVLGSQVDDVIVAVVNRVPEPRVANFVVMQPLRIARLRTNVDRDQDVRFTGSIAGSAMTVTAVDFGTLLPGATVFGVDVATSTQIVSGPGGAGSYQVSVAQTLSSRTLSAGGATLEQGAEFTVQLDFHSADNRASSLAQIVSTVLRDPVGVRMFAEQSPNYGVVPLYADDPRYLPFNNEAQQYEWRWSLDAHFQINQQVRSPQQYADAVDVEVISAVTLP
jgi:hypothetical protein